MKKEAIEELIVRLRAEHPDAVCELRYQKPFELLVAVILSAQCTDKRVNAVTDVLFREYNTPEQFATMDEETLIPYIRSCGFYRNKCAAILETSRMLIEDFGGRVPETVEELMRLRGVGRKTANVVYSNAFGGDAIAVDTHVQRVSNRIGLAHAKKVEETERQLNEAVPKEHWSELHHLLIHHGRYTCAARAPRCNDCTVTEFCENFLKSRSK